MRRRDRRGPLFAPPRRRWRRPAILLAWATAFGLVGAALVLTVGDLGTGRPPGAADHPHPDDPGSIILGHEH